MQNLAASKGTRKPDHAVLPFERYPSQILLILLLLELIDCGRILFIHHVTFRNLNLKGIISKEIPCLHFVLELPTLVSRF